MSSHQQHQQLNSSAGAPGQIGSSSSAKATAGLRSDSTRPGSVPRSKSNTRGSSVSGLTRQGSAGSISTGSVRAARGGTTTTSTSSASTTTAGRQGIASSSAAVANGSSVLSARHLAAQTAASNTTPTTVATPGGAAATGGGGAITPAPPAGPRVTPPYHDVSQNKRNNPLYGDEHPNMTPQVNRRDYPASLSPEDLQGVATATRQQQQQLVEEAQHMANEAAAAGSSSGAAFRSSRITSRANSGGGAGSSSGAGAMLAAKPPKPQHYLRTTGDLFNPPDQDSQEACVVGVSSTTQLVSPGWNQHRPWLTGSWIMSRPAEFVQEAAVPTAAAGGGGAEQQQVQQAQQQQSQVQVVLPPLRELCDVDPQMAEALLVDDLLTVMMGQAGQYIKHQLVEGDVYPRLGLWVQGVPDPSLQEQVERLLPLCECVFVIKRFVETRSQIQYPMVAQALAAAMRKLQEEWWVLVVQLEHQCKLGQLNLAALLYYCQAPAASLALLANIAGEAAAKVELTSAGLLNLLVARQRSLAGDRQGQALVGQLLEAAAEPYFGILRQWMCSGVLDDPYGEFMVKEDRDVAGDSLTPEGEAAYWALRYTIRRGVTEDFDVPVFLGSSVDAILVTGKYLNVIRACAQPVPPCPDSTLAQLRYDAAAAERGSPPFLAGIQAALSAAAGALLSHMTGPQGRLLSWLACLKHFFLLDQGDFLVHLMEAGEAESLSSLAPHQLQGLLDAALRSSSLAASPHVDVLGGGVGGGDGGGGGGGVGVLGVRVDRRSILQLVTAATVSGGQQDHASSLRAAVGGGSGSSGWEDMMLTLNTGWPLNLVVCKRQLLHYQVLFKQLLSLKHAEKQLGYVWQALRATKRLGKEDQARFREWHLLCSKLLHVVGEVLRYTSIDVLEPLWCDMYARLVQAGNMDEVIQLHNAFLSAALQRSLLLQAEVVQHIHNLLAAAKELSKVVESIDTQQTGSSSVGGAPSSGVGGSSSMNRQRTSAAQHHLQMLSSFCQQPTRREQLAQLKHKVDKELEALVVRLEGYQRHLSQAPPGAPASSFRGGVVGVGGAVAVDGGYSSGGGGGSAASRLMGGGQWRWGGSVVAAVGDSSRELASLENLIKRLKLGDATFEQQMMRGY